MHFSGKCEYLENTNIFTTKYIHISRRCSALHSYTSWNSTCFPCVPRPHPYYPMSMPEHECAKGSSPDPALCATTFTAESIQVCDTRCQADPCCQRSQECDLQHGPIQCTVGKCVSNRQGGCQRSISGSPSICCGPTSSCPDLAQGMPLQIVAAFSVHLIIACSVF